MTLDSRAEFDICPVCFWEDDAYILIKQEKEISSLYHQNEDIAEEALLDIPSGANHGLTLRQGQENYKNFGACEKDMKKYVRKPRKEEL